jgi:hypothetical protein
MNPTRRDEVKNANARLIAAAPDLLQACRVALQFMEQDRVDTYYEPTLDDLQQVRNAITKAEGHCPPPSPYCPARLHPPK